MPDQVGQQIGRYRLVSLLGSGGFASVYRAEDTELGREVAVKLLHPHLSADDAFVRRFRAEARAAARLRHPNIVTIYDVGVTADGQTYLVMALLEGTLLSKLTSRGPLPFRQIERIISQLAAALDYLHSQRLIHRDLKPPNVMIDAAGDVSLMDFGIARSLDDHAHLTQAGTMVGTPAYMAPEQVNDGAITAATDIYALGILIYELFAGRPPFVGSPTAVMSDQLYKPPPPLAQFNPNVPAAAVQAIEQALAKDPAQRPSSAGAFARLFGSPATVSPPSAAPTTTADPRGTIPARPAKVPPAVPSRSRRPLFAGGLAALAILGLVFVIFVRRDSSGTISSPAATSRVVEPVPAGATPIAATGSVVIPAAAGAGATSIPSPNTTMPGQPAAGSTGAGVSSLTDGQGAVASFNLPRGIALGAGGALYVSDSGNNRIRVVTPSGKVSTLAGAGTCGAANGMGEKAQFCAPEGIAVDASGNVYVADAGSLLVRKISPAGAVSTLAGSGTAGVANGRGTEAQFGNLAGIAVDPSGSVYVADQDASSIRKIAPDGVVSSFAGSGRRGFADGASGAAMFDNPDGLAFDAAGNLYVADSGNNRIRTITPSGTVGTLAGTDEYGYSDGPGTGARFANPIGVAVGRSANIYETDGEVVRRISADGFVTTIAGSTIDAAGFADGSLDSARFNSPAGLVVDAGGRVYVADLKNQRIRVIVTDDAR